MTFKFNPLDLLKTLPDIEGKLDHEYKVQVKGEWLIFAIKIEAQETQP